MYGYKTDLKTSVLDVLEIEVLLLCNSVAKLIDIDTSI
jgi:hypothetical protein